MTFADLALAFHHTLRGDHHTLTATIGRLNELTATGDFTYFTDIARFMARQPLPRPSTARWLEPEETVRRR